MRRHLAGHGSDHHGDGLIINGVKIQRLLQFHCSSDRILDAVQPAVRERDAEADVLSSDATCLPFADGTGELILMSGVIYEIEDVSKHRVVFQEIERVLKEHPSIFNVQVVGVSDDRRGEVPAAFVGLASGVPELTLESLRDWASERMAPFKIPRKLKLMRSSEWPRTSSTKIARFQLASLL